MVAIARLDAQQPVAHRTADEIGLHARMMPDYRCKGGGETDVATRVRTAAMGTPGRPPLTGIGMRSPCGSRRTTGGPVRGAHPRFVLGVMGKR